MRSWRDRFYKPALAALMVVLLFGVAGVQKELNLDRARLGLTRVEPLENAPPVLAFTTVALGGFRGLIANALWVRAVDMQDDGKYFEMVQLADWITKLEPHLVQVWIVQAWNMAYNISIKFNDPRDRWMWVRKGIELLRDEGLRYNPHETLIYRELAWFYQHKMGANMDDAHMYFKQAWAEEMARVLKGGHPNFDELIHPTSDDARARAKMLRSVYKLDPELMKEVDERYGPLEWRLPETHAIYWASVGLKNCQTELMTLRRAVYQSMQTAFHRGHLIERTFEFSPNLDIIPKVNASYEEMMAADAENREHIKTGHRNFLLDAVYFLFTENRQTAAQQWFNYLKEKYPDAQLDKPPTPIKNMTVDEYAVARVNEEIGDTSVDKTKLVIEGFFRNAFYNLAIGEEEKFEGLTRMAQRIWSHYQARIAGGEKRIGLPPLALLKQEVLDGLLNSTNGIDPNFKAALRGQLGIGQPPEAAPVTNAPLSGVEGTNAPPAKAQP